ncbi:hypothetical protein SMICM304S_05152 [Streptomyces microflavus]
MTHRQSYDDHVDIDAWVWWLIVAAGLGIPLVLTAMPELGMFAVGALAASVVAALGGGIVAQVLVFVGVSVALLLSSARSPPDTGPDRPGTPAVSTP